MIYRICGKCGQAFQADPWVDDVDICKTCLGAAQQSIPESDTEIDDVSVVAVEVDADLYAESASPQQPLAGIHADPELTMDFMPGFGKQNSQISSMEPTDEWVPIPPSVPNCAEQAPEAIPSRETAERLESLAVPPRWKRVISIVAPAARRVAACAVFLILTPILIDALSAYSRPLDEAHKIIAHLRERVDENGAINRMAKAEGDRLESLLLQNIPGMPQPSLRYLWWALASRWCFIILAASLFAYSLAVLAQCAVRLLLFWETAGHARGRIKDTGRLLERITETCEVLAKSPWFPCFFLLFLLCPLFPATFILEFPERINPFT